MLTAADVDRGQLQVRRRLADLRVNATIRIRLGSRLHDTGGGCVGVGRTAAPTEAPVCGGVRCEHLANRAPGGGGGADLSLCG